MNKTISINELIDDLPSTIRYEHLLETWRSLARSLDLDPDNGMDMIVSVPRDLTLRRNDLLDSSWGGAWEWNLSDGLTKAAVISILVAAALTAVGAGTGIAPVLIPTVVPFLFDLKRVRMERSAENCLLILGARSELCDRQGNAASLYESLPPELKDTISRNDFEGFLSHAVDAGRAKSSDGQFEILPSGQTAFRISIR